MQPSFFCKRSKSDRCPKNNHFTRSSGTKKVQVREEKLSWLSCTVSECTPPSFCLFLDAVIATWLEFDPAEPQSLSRKTRPSTGASVTPSKGCSTFQAPIALLPASVVTRSSPQVATAQNERVTQPASTSTSTLLL
ncbi:hypothetical protein RUM43_000305 [Polyplax serrata]|uniref:Uncharacterized protein n=1 Tax=Polyplax serrata TaxID=468196 RepID=A0AAN8SCC5_POLSC